MTLTRRSRTVLFVAAVALISLATFGAYQLHRWHQLSAEVVPTHRPLSTVDPEFEDVNGDGLIDAVGMPMSGDQQPVYALQVRRHEFAPEKRFAYAGDRLFPRNLGEPMIGVTYKPSPTMYDVTGDGLADVVTPAVRNDRPDAWLAMRRGEPGGRLGPIERESIIDENGRPVTNTMSAIHDPDGTNLYDGFPVGVPRGNPFVRQSFGITVHGYSQAGPESYSDAATAVATPNSHGALQIGAILPGAWWPMSSLYVDSQGPTVVGRINNWQRGHLTGPEFQTIEGGRVVGHAELPRNVRYNYRLSDITGDGIRDLFYVNQDRRVVLLAGSRGGSFQHPRIMPGLRLNAGGSIAGAADVTGDGRIDLVEDFQVRGHERFCILRGTGSGFDQTGSSLRTAEEALVRQVMDVDGDGHADLIFDDGSIAWGNGDGTFS
jgi:hypothetical protein